MILPSISLLKRIKSPFGLRKKLNALRMRGSNLTDIQSSKRLCWSVVFSSFCSPSSGSLEIQDYAPQVPISAETNRPMSRLTHSSAKRLTLKLTRPSTISAALRSAGCFNPSQGKVITSIFPATSGLTVQILCTQEGKLTD